MCAMLRRETELRHAAQVRPRSDHTMYTMRADIIGHFKPCMNDIYIHIDARMADHIRTHP